MALVTVRAAAERLGVAILDAQAMGPHRPRADDADRGRSPSRLRRRDRSPDGAAAARTAGARVRAADADESLAGLSARNRLHGFIDEVRIDGLLAQVRLRVGDQSLTAVITADAVRALKLRRGDDALAIIKSTEVMIATSRSSATHTKRRSRK